MLSKETESSAKNWYKPRHSTKAKELNMLYILVLILLHSPQTAQPVPKHTKLSTIPAVFSFTFFKHFPCPGMSDVMLQVTIKNE
jgi:hypothetical protein